MKVNKRKVEKEQSSSVDIAQAFVVAPLPLFPMSFWPNLIDELLCGVKTLMDEGHNAAEEMEI